MPYWHIYETEGTADTICLGGTLAGEFTAGLSGGQRKLLLFELLCQRLLPPPQTRTTTSTTTTNDESQEPKQQEQPEQQPPPESSSPHQTGVRIPQLLCLDEPFCGVTDDYVSFVTKRLHQLQRYHFIVLVTNDHVEALTQMAHHILTVSAVDRTVVELQLPPPPQQQPVVSDDEKDQDDEENPFQTPGAPPESTTTTTSQTKNPTTVSSSSSSKKTRQVVSRELMIQALSVVGQKDWRNGGRRGSTRSTRSSFHTTDTNATSDDAATTMTTTTTTTSLWSDAYFFYQVEVVSNCALWGVVLFTLVCLGLFVVAFWNSHDDQAALVLVGGDVIAFFCVNPYLLSLVEWRIAMHEESQALVHSSPALYRALKTALTMTLILVVSWAEFGVVIAVMTDSSLSSRFSIWIGMFTDSLSMTFALIGLGIYTHLEFQRVEILGTLPFLLMVFFSTTFSPGSGLPGIKELRYLFARFYFWCLVPIDDMEGCPDTSNEWTLVVYMCLASLVGVVLFGSIQVVRACRTRSKTAQTVEFRQSLLLQPDFVQLQRSLFGDHHMLQYRRRESLLDPNDDDDDYDAKENPDGTNDVEQPTSQTTSSNNKDYDAPLDDEECLPEDEV